ncbi:MAG: autotransporter-associated beta strand repeat-containing protein, partial [Gemmataceae bacterium]|nr:autotransporter-associated beta strand repeat-containing protein [Gemmataceae bacterium]
MFKLARRNRWTGWAARKPSLLRPFPVLGLEQLEVRDTPATFTWTGAGANQLWSTPANWQGGVAPTGNPLNVEDLVFPAGPTQRVAVNNISGGIFNSITYGAGGYTLSGSPLTLGGISGVSQSGNLVVTAGAVDNALAMNVTLGAAAGNFQTFSILDSAALTVSGRLAGVANSTLTKDGAGTLTLTNDNSGFAGFFRLNNNAGQLVITNPNALGTTSARTIVGAGSSVRVLVDAAGAITVREPITLNGLGFANDGALSTLSGTTNWDAPVVLDSDAALGASAGSVLNVTGVVSDSGAGFALYKEGAGEVRLASPTGNTYRRQTIVDDGVLTATHPLSLGAGGTTLSGTIVNYTLTQAGQLRLADLAPTGADGNPTGFTVRDEFLTINGPGRDFLENDGALANTVGNNYWAGPVTLGSPAPNVAVAAAVGAAAGTTLTVSGVVSSPNGPYALTKVDAGRVVLDNANTYTGTTLVAQGALTARDSTALGTVGGSTGAEVQAAQVIGSPGTFQIFFSGAGTIPLPFNATAPQVEAAVNALSTVVSAGGKVSVTATRIAGGTQYNIIFGGAFVGLNLPQIQALGAGNVAADTITVRDGGGSATAVVEGGSLELEVEAGDLTIPQRDAHGRDLGNDSVTGDPNRLRVAEPITIFGRGLDTTDNGRTGGTGALRSVSGINVTTAPIELGYAKNVADAIGVDQDRRAGHPTPDATYFTADYSLTTQGVILGNLDPELDRATEFVKRGEGHLILPIANTYLGTTRIEQGWATARNAASLGGRFETVVRPAPAANVNPIGQGDTAQPPTVVSAGAALHLRPLTPGTNLTFPENLTIAGVGPTHPYSFIDRRGALMNLDGNNTWAGDVGLVGQAGIGVEQVIGGSRSDLVVTGTLRGGQNSFNLSSNGGQAEQAFLIDTGAPAGVVRVTYNFFTLRDRLTAYYPPRGEAGSTRILDTGYINNAPDLTPRTLEFPFGPGTSNRVELVVNEGGNPDPFTVWELSAEAEVDGGLIKFGSKRLSLQGEGTYGGVTEVREGTLRSQNDTALGRKFSGTARTQGTYTQTATVVSPAAVLELAGSIDRLNGGVAAGTQVFYEQLVLDRPGQQVAVAGSTVPGFTGTFTLSYRGQVTPPLSITATAADVAAALNALSTVRADFASDGGATVTRTGNVYTVVFGNTRSVSAPLLVATASGGAEVAVSGGPAGLVVSSEDHTWRGAVTLRDGARVDVRTRARVSLHGPIDDAVNPSPAGSDLAKRGAGELLLAGPNTFRGTTAIDEGVVTAANSTAFGATAGGTVVADGAQLQLQGNLTVAGEALTLRGTGPAAVSAFEDTVRWVNTGPGPTNNGLSGNTLPTSGRVTSAVADPSDPSTVYVATAGGGAWKTTDGGVTWNPLFDLDPDGNGLIYGGSFAVAQSDPRVVYFATGDTNGYPTGSGVQGPAVNYAGTGVYKSTDAGRTWTVLTTTGGANPLRGQAVSKIIVDPEVADRIYVASGTSNVLNADPAAVPGVWRYDGADWFNLTGGPSPNRLSVPGTGDFAAPPAGVGAPENAGPDDDYRIMFPQTNATWSDIQLIKRGFSPFTGASEWVLYAALGESFQKYYQGPTSQGIFNAVYRTEDPDSTGANPTWWLGTGTVFVRSHTTGPDIPQPLPPLPPPTPPDQRANPFPVGPITPPIPYIPPGRNGWIKLAGTQDNYLQPTARWPLTKNPNEGITNDFIYGVINPHITVYASVVWPDYQDLRGELRDIQKTGWDGGIATTWQATGAVPVRPFGTATFDPQIPAPPNSPYYRNIVKGTGRYNNALLVQSSTPLMAADNEPDVVYLAGRDDIFVSTNGGQAWSVLPPDPTGNKPGNQYQSLTRDFAGRLVIGTDGGVWRYDPTVAPADRRYVNLNGDLAVTQLNSADPHPTDLNQALAGATDSGTQRFDGGLAWARLDDTAGSNTGVVRYDPRNPLVAYAARDGQLRKTTDGGATWFTLRNVSTVPPDLKFADLFDPFNRSYGTARVSPVGPGGNTGRVDQYQRNEGSNFFPLVVDPINTSRVLIGNPNPVVVGDPLGGAPDDIIANNLLESSNGGLTFTNLNAGITVTAIGTATFQGRFALDPEPNALGASPPGFPNVTDKGSNTYDPDTIYVAGYFQQGLTQANRREELRVTKDHGTSWIVRTPPGATPTDPAPITDITVDPANRDTVYVTRSRRVGQPGGRVYRSTDAGRNWTDITGNDADMQAPAYATAVDPRDGTLYLGNEHGVWSLRNAADTTSYIWVKFGAGMPRVAVKDLVLNQTLNTLTAATNGRGMFQLLLTDYQPSSGALRALSGASVWTGNVTLTGDTTIGAAGTQQLQNGIASASVNLIGRVADDTPGANHELRKIGLGTLILSGANTYGGQTLVQEGVLQVNNPRALGAFEPAATANTVVSDGAALELRSDLEAEPVTVNGRGFPFNQRFTGALRNVSSNNTYTGTLTLATDSTIGVDSGTSLTIGRKADLVGIGTITDGAENFALDKEGPGTLILAEANTYDGLTRVAAGALQVQDALALGSTGLAGGPADTRVLDGAQLQIARNAFTGDPTVVVDEHLFLSGSGIDKTGALLNVHPDADPAGATNVWRGPVTFNLDPSTAPPTVPSSQVSIGVSDPADTLVIDGPIDQVNSQASFGLIKVGPGRLTLAQANVYTGVTNVEAGTLTVRGPDALGPAVSSEVQTVAVVGSVDPATGLPYQFTLSFNGDATGLLDASTITAAVVRSKLGALPSVGGTGNLIVAESPTSNGKTFTVTFRNALGNQDLPTIVAGSISPGLSVNVTEAQRGGLGTVVSAGATLEIEGDTGGGFTVSEVLALNGDGVGAGGALRNASGANTYAGPITLETDASIGAAADSTLSVTGTIRDPNPAPVPAARLRKAGEGVVELRTANPYAGLTVVDEGVLRVFNPSSLGNSGPEVQLVQVTGSAGTFTLIFDGQPTTPLLVTATAADVAAALNALPNIGGVGGSVAVTRTGSAGNFFYEVTFGGTLAGADQPQLTATATGAANAFISTTREGPGATVVNTGATLQVAGGITMNREAVTINGPGFNGQGALNSFLGNLNVWAVPLTLGSDASIGTTTVVQVFSFTAPITDNGLGFGLDIVGPGTVSYDGTADNTYSGTTTVRAGTLRLNQAAGIAVNGDLVVGDGAAPAVVRATRDDQIADTSDVAVNATGTYDLNGRADTIADLSVTGGSVLTGAGGSLTAADVTMAGGTITAGANATLTVRDVDMTGGTIAAGANAVVTTRDIRTAGGAITLAAGSELNLTGDITGTSTAAGSASITGPGTLDLNGAVRTVIVTDGPQPEDLRITAVPTAAAGEGLVKDGAGRLVLAPTAPTAVPVRVVDGDLQADGDVGPKTLDGPNASLSGVGSVDSVGGASGPAVGTVSPGNNWRLNPAGVLRVTGDVVWGAATTYFVDLDASSHPTPPAGADYDQLRATGTVTLGGATLSGSFGPGVLLGDRFTIITAGSVVGRFAEPFGPNVVFIGGQKFRVVYTATTVELEKVKADVAVTVAASRNPSTLREPVTFTATVTPEPGAGPVPTDDTVTFTVDGVSYGPFMLDASGRATFTTTAVPGGFLAGGTHTVSAAFSGDALNFNAGTSPVLTQVVEVPAIAPLVGSPALISPNNSPGVQDAFTAATTVTQERALTDWTVVVKNSAGDVVRTFSERVPRKPSPGADNSFAIAVTWDGRDQTGAFVPDGDYTLTASFQDEFGNTAAAAPITVRVDSTSPDSTPVTSPVPVIAPLPVGLPAGTASMVPTTTRLTGTVGDENLDHWTVRVLDAGGAEVRRFEGAAGATAVDITWDGRDSAGNVVPDGVYSLVIEVLDRAGNVTRPAAATVVVLDRPPSIGVSSNGPTTYGQSITLTAAVTPLVPGLAGLLEGDEVRFFQGTTLLGTGTLVLVGGEYRASVTVPTFNAGTYSDITAAYPGSEFFLPGTSAPFTHVVVPAVLSVQADDATKVYGQPVPPLTFRVSGLVNGDTEAEVVSGLPGTAATAASPVGAYPITQGTLTANPNYTVTFTPGTLTVTPAPLTVRVNDATKVFNRPNPPFTAAFEGLLLGDTPAVVQNLNLVSTATQSSKVGTYPITARGTPTALNYTITVIPGTLTVTPIPSEIDVGTGPGATATVTRYDPDGRPFGTLTPFGSFAGGVRTATADLNGDGIEDVVMGTGPGTQARVLVIDGNTDEVLYSAFPFGDFTGGVFVATGDLTGDGRADLVVTPDEGGGPRVQIIRGGDFAPVVSFFGIQDPNFRGGVRAAVGDINADGFADLAVAAGFGGGPRVALWDGKALA